ncbi:HTTM domain-containing protein [Acidothermaceae bacterium B102]|nr:HTTM domain-containing protein [Acidothermaceae bacterium B102]
MAADMSAFWFADQPLSRVAWLRTIVYLFIPVDVLLTTPWVASHGDLAHPLYQPLLIGRILPLPTPTHTGVHLIEVCLLLASLVAAANRAPRLAGSVVALLYLEWMDIAFSYGKVDHDRFAFLVALCVLPTVGRARWKDTEASDAAGWALRTIQVGVVATYFLSTYAKWRYGGVGWLNSATLVTAILRKGTPLGHQLLHVPWLLVISQWGIVAMELSSVGILFVRSNRVRYLWVLFFIGFHVATMLTISIIFLPHIVAALSFLPVEALALLPALVRRRVGAAPASPPARATA